MRFRICLSVLSAVLISALAPAAAEPPREALQLYAEGDYVAAAESAEGAANAQSLAFAARAMMAACVTSPNRRDLNARLDRAERAAREALRLDPDSVEARLQWALTLGVRGRRASIAEAVARNYAPRGKRLIEQALAREPDNAWAHALLGAWHLEVLRRGGRTGAALYGARAATGLREFERARALAPDDPLIALHYAIALIEYDPATHAERAETLLRQASAHRPRDAFEAHTLDAGRDVARALADNGPEAARRAALAAFL